MRTTITYLALTLFLAVLLAGCGAMVHSPVTGGLYTEVKGPITATANPTYSKVGTAFCTSILGIIATGDASIETAAKNGGITKIHHVDYESKNILGLYAKYTVIVYGE
jgi:hypothetical protein